MTNELARQVDAVEPTDSQRAKLYELVRDNPWIGTKAAGRQAGIAGTGGQIRAFLEADDQYLAVRDEARGAAFTEARLNPKTLLANIGDIANTDGPRQLDANKFGLALQGLNPEQSMQVEHTGVDGGPVEVTNPDVAAALDRFTNTIRRLAERAQPSGDLREADTARAALPAGNTRS